MSSLRKSTRATAGHLPSRYKDDIIPDDVLQTLGAENSVVEMQSSLSRTPSQGGQVRSGGRPRGRPRTKHLHQRPADNVGIAVMANDDVCYETRVLQKYPDAAFPTLDFPTAIAVRGNASIAPVAKRDSMDIWVSKSPTGISSQAANQGQILPKVEKFVLDGRYIDAAGNTLHGLAAYYDAHLHQYENEHHDSQGDSREKNAAFKLFLETPEAEQAMRPGAGGNGLVTEAFDRWWKKHGMKSVLKSSAEDMNHIKAFKDEVRRTSFSEMLALTGQTGICNITLQTAVGNHS